MVALEPRVFHGKVGRQCIGETGLGKHATFSYHETSSSRVPLAP